MKRRPLLASLLALPTLALATGTDESAQARTAAMAWLNQTDAGEHGAAWTSASAIFRNAVTLARWQQAVQGVRGPLGELRNRKEKSLMLTRTLPGAPDGQYAVIQFDTGFASKAQSVETVTTVQDADGSWRVTGYFIR